MIWSCPWGKTFRIWYLSVGSHTADSPGPPQATSSPVPTNTNSNNQTNSKRLRHFKPLRLVNVNCQSLRNMDKVTDLHTIINRVKQDILVLKETWLDDKILTGAIIPQSLNMTDYRADRPSQPYGGILVAVSNEYLSCEVPEPKTDYESVWVQIKVLDAKKLLICGYYRPNERDEESLKQLDLALSRSGSRNCHTWIAGDFNFPDFNWSDPQIKRGSSSTRLHNRFLSLLEDHGLSQSGWQTYPQPGHLRPHTDEHQQLSKHGRNSPSHCWPWCRLHWGWHQATEGLACAQESLPVALG